MLRIVLFVCDVVCISSLLIYSCVYLCDVRDSFNCLDVLELFDLDVFGLCCFVLCLHCWILLQF